MESAKDFKSLSSTFNAEMMDIKRLDMRRRGLIPINANDAQVEAAYAAFRSRQIPPLNRHEQQMRDYRVTTLQRFGIDASGMDESQIDAAMEKHEQAQKVIRDEKEKAQREYREAFDAQDQAARREQLFKISGCPPLHVNHLDLIDANPRWVKVRDALITGLEGAGYMFALLGPRGVGKTQLAVSVIHHACQQCKVSRYVTAADFFSRIRATFNGAGSESDVLKVYQNADLLILDDSHQRGHSSWEQDQLTALIDTRYREMKFTILIANLFAEQFTASVGDSIASRLTEMGGVIKCDWPSYRTGKRKA